MLKINKNECYENNCYDLEKYEIEEIYDIMKVMVINAATFA